MEEEKINLLVPEDELIDDVDKQYTEELDFSNINEEIEKVKEEPITPVPLEPIYDNVAPEEPYYDDVVKEEPVVEEPKAEQKVNYNPGENPYAKVVLNKTEEVVETINHKDVKIDFKNNKSLWFVVGIGAVLLIAVFLLPYLM